MINGVARAQLQLAAASGIAQGVFQQDGENLPETERIDRQQCLFSQRYPGADARFIQLRFDPLQALAQDIGRGYIGLFSSVSWPASASDSRCSSSISRCRQLSCAMIRAS